MNTLEKMEVLEVISDFYKFLLAEYDDQPIYLALPLAINRFGDELIAYTHSDLDDSLCLAKAVLERIKQL